jgi:SOS response associated peptidase (SRAP)
MYALGLDSELGTRCCDCARHNQREIGDCRYEACVRDPFKIRRCLIPADGFYEWKRNGSSKQPYCFEVNNGELFAFAGL